MAAVAVAMYVTWAPKAFACAALNIASAAAAVAADSHTDWIAVGDRLPVSLLHPSLNAVALHSRPPSYYVRI